ncbi:MAG: hypothetical protein GBAus27B_000424 [Mycoplasmataceae bacterium]|nr:MAG: hypothetical protein GBAus27B_000424 [Mycoplasmataceae bacterium]
MNNKELTFTEKKLIKCFDRPSIRIRIPRLEINQGKFPLVKNWPIFYEPLTIEKILEQGFNYGIRTGKKIGSYYLIVIDLDDKWANVRLPVNRFIKTSKGIHVYCLIKEQIPYLILENSQGDRIGELHRANRQVVGIGSIHKTGIRYSLKLQGKSNSPWFCKFDSLKDLESFLNAQQIFCKNKLNF